jgi:hypothetical protein
MKDIDKFIGAVVAIGLITAFATHASDLANLTKATAIGGGTVLNAAEKG